MTERELLVSLPSGHQGPSLDTVIAWTPEGAREQCQSPPLPPSWPRPLVVRLRDSVGGEGRTQWGGEPDSGATG